jgi:hypothetical protein
MLYQLTSDDDMSSTDTVEHVIIQHYYTNTRSLFSEGIPWAYREQCFVLSIFYLLPFIIHWTIPNLQKRSSAGVPDGKTWPLPFAAIVSRPQAIASQEQIIWNVCKGSRRIERIHLQCPIWRGFFVRTGWTTKFEELVISPFYSTQRRHMSQLYIVLLSTAFMISSV